MGPRVWGIGRDRTGFFAERDDLRRSETRKIGAEKQGVVEEGGRGEKNNCRRTRLRGLQPRTCPQFSRSEAHGRLSESPRLRIQLQRALRLKNVSRELLSHYPRLPPDPDTPQVPVVPLKVLCIVSECGHLLRHCFGFSEGRQPLLPEIWTHSSFNLSVGTRIRSQEGGAPLRGEM